MSEVLLVVLGWLLGTLSPGIAEAIGRGKRRRELLAVIGTELHELRFLVALVLVQVRSKLHTMDQPALDLVKPLLLDYRGPDHDDVQFLEGTKKLLELGDAQYIAMHNAPTAPGGALWPIAYDAPFLVAHIQDLALFSAPRQRALLRVVSELHLFGEQVALVRRFNDRTFDTSLSPANYAANDANLVSATTKLGRRAEALIQVINRLLDSNGRTRPIT